MITKEKAQALANWYQELADSDNGFTNQNISGRDGNQYPNMSNSIKYIKCCKVNPPKPKIKKIDLSVCIKSGIDMEFATYQNDWEFISPLKTIEIDKVYPFIPILQLEGGDRHLKQCRVRENHWHSHQGGIKPIPFGLDIEILQRNGDKAIGYNLLGTTLSWEHTNGEYDIIAFKVIGVAEGFTY